MVILLLLRILLASLSLGVPPREIGLARSTEFLFLFKNAGGGVGAERREPEATVGLWRDGGANKGDPPSKFASTALLGFG